MGSPFNARLLRHLLGLTFALAFALGAHAQTQITTGTVQGHVTDEQGAVVPGAAVEVRNVETNLSRTLTTDDDGRFVFLQLPPGRYTLTASKQGFATLEQEPFTLTVGQAATLDLAMKVSQIGEKITVSAVQTVDTSNTQTTTTIEERAVSNLPVLGRKFEDLLTLTPNVSIVQGPDGDEINFAGQRGVFNNISLDGGDYNNGFFGEQVGGQRAAIDIPLGRAGLARHQVRHQRVPRLALPFPAPRSADLEHLRRQVPHRLPPRAVRRHHRRPHQERPHLLLLRQREHPREPDARQPLRADRRHALPRRQPDRHGRRGPD
jgi:hypothetical protein